MPRSEEVDIKKNHVILKIKITNKLGLHARPAAMLVQSLSKYQSEITLKKANQKVNAKSIMGVMMLAAGPNAHLTFDIEGPDAELVVQEIEDLFKRNFDE